MRFSIISLGLVATMMMTMYVHALGAGNALGEGRGVGKVAGADNALGGGGVGKVADVADGIKDKTSGISGVTENLGDAGGLDEITEEGLFDFISGTGDVLGSSKLNSKPIAHTSGRSASRQAQDNLTRRGFLARRKLGYVAHKRAAADRTKTAEDPSTKAESVSKAAAKNDGAAPADPEDNYEDELDEDEDEQDEDEDEQDEDEDEQDEDEKDENDTGARR